MLSGDQTKQRLENERCRESFKTQRASLPLEMNQTFSSFSFFLPTGCNGGMQPELHPPTTSHNTIITNSNYACPFFLLSAHPSLCPARLLIFSPRSPPHPHPPHVFAAFNVHPARFCSLFLHQPLYFITPPLSLPLKGEISLLIILFSVNAQTCMHLCVLSNVTKTKKNTFKLDREHCRQGESINAII